jgi:hypothetical protein
VACPPRFMSERCFDRSVYLLAKVVDKPSEGEGTRSIIL